YRCHGVMGQRQVELDKHQPFLHAMVYALPGDADAKYGALARDGISCDACHRIAKEELGQPSTFTGQFKIDPPNVVNGPYDQLVTVPMKNTMGITPRFAEQIKTSALCGSCHPEVLHALYQHGKRLLETNGT